MVHTEANLPVAVAPEEKARYTAIIDGILTKADLETVSRKKIRQSLEVELGGKDLSEQKVRDPFAWRLALRFLLTASCPRLPSSG